LWAATQEVAAAPPAWSNLERILRLQASAEEVGKEISGKVLEIASGVQSCSGRLGHQEFVFTYESFEPSAAAEWVCPKGERHKN